MLIRKKSAHEKALSLTQIIDRLDTMGASTASGEAVTVDTALQQSTVFACVRILSESIAMVPIKLMRRNGSTNEEVTEHRALRLLESPNEFMTRHEFLQLLISECELAGNSYWYKVKTGRGEVARLLPLPTSSVSAKLGADWSVHYTVSLGKGGLNGTFGKDQIFHCKNVSSDGVSGMSTVAMAREAIGLARATERHGAAIFANGAQLGKVFTHPGALSDVARANIEASIRANYGGAAKAGSSIVLEEGMDVKTVSMTAEDSQFLETRKFQVEDIARVFGVPLYLLNSTEKATTWGSGLEEMNRGFLRHTLGPRLSRLRHTLKQHLLTESDRRSGLFFEFDTNAFQHVDVKERFEAYRTGIEAGVLSPNEARRYEQLNPRSGGDEFNGEARSDENKTP